MLNHGTFDWYSAISLCSICKTLARSALSGHIKQEDVFDTTAPDKREYPANILLFLHENRECEYYFSMKK